MFAVVLLLASVINISHAADGWQKDSAAVRRLVVQNAEVSHRKQANVPGTPAYFLGVPTAELQRNMRNLDYYRSGGLYAAPWSGFYWPNYLGGLGYRRPDPYFPRKDWGKSRQYVLGKPSAGVQLSRLSPSEKYDIVMGVSPEDAGSLTSKQWALGEKEYAETGKVATWQGICNGWAAASIYLAMPRQTVTVPSSRGNMTFSIDDVMALGSLLYAKGKFTSVYAGRRCYTGEENGPRPARSERTEECFDMNPGDWHIITTNMLGMRRKPFIVDYVNTREVWNKPVIAYSLNYFDMMNRRTLSYTYSNVKRTTRSISFNRAHRAPDAAFVVGVNMTATLLFGSTSEDNGAQTVRTVEYSYMLELDRYDNIVGGEWISSKHPDFAWMPKLADLPTSLGDDGVALLTPATAGQSPGWRDSALMANDHGSPLPRFVQYLFTRSSAWK